MSDTQFGGKHKALSEVPAPTAKPWVRRTVAFISTLIMITTAAGGGVVYKLNALDKNIQVIDTQDLNTPGTSPTPVAPSDTSAINFLIMGSDSRSGQGAGFGNASGARSDTTLIVHIYEGRKKAVAISIPRDSLVTIPKCTGLNGNPVGPWTTKFNAAFAIGGPVCTIKTIQSTTGLHIDKFVVVDFNAFKAIVDAIGGVTVCFTTPVYDPVVPGRGGSGLNLPAGFSTLTGKQALAVVRARETLGDGSDLGRIQRQHEFLSSMIRGIEQQGVLTNPALLYQILTTVTSSISTSQDLASVQALEDFALSLVSLKPANIAFTTTPYELLGDGNVHWIAKTQRMWDAVKAEEPWPPVSDATPTPMPSGSASPTPTETPTPGLITPPSSVKVIVLNGTATSGLAQKVASQLRKRGFIVTSTGNAKTQVALTEVRYNARFKAGADTLAYSAQSTSKFVDSTLTTSLVLVVGADWTTARKVVIGEQNPTDGITNAGSTQCSEGNNRIKIK
ncbi:MAG: LCP family protein [Actinomycetes bacterium]